MTPILVSLGQISIYSGFISQTTYSTFLLGCLIGLTNYTYLQRRSKPFSLNLLILVIIPILVSKWHHTYLFFPLISLYDNFHPFSGSSAFVILLNVEILQGTFLLSRCRISPDDLIYMLVML